MSRSGSEIIEIPVTLLNRCGRRWINLDRQLSSTFRNSGCRDRESPGVDFPAPASLDGIVDADHHFAVGQQHRQEMEQQSTSHVAGVPTRPVEHFMVAAETGHHGLLRGRFDALLSYRIRRVASPPSRKSPPIPADARTSLPTARDDHSTYRALPLFQGNLVRGTPQPHYTLYSAQSGALVARLRPTKCNDRFEVLYWSLWKNRWTSTGPLGRTVLSIKGALGFIAYEDIFWVMT
jgi:hypothetical protein